MTKWTIIGLLVAFSSVALAEDNITQAAKDTNDTNTTIKTVNPKQLDKHVKEQMAREENYAKTQSFAQGDDYNLSEHQVDPKDLENVKVDEPMYDFNMDDVYD